ncbi:hypothetical protein EDC04DRAFT_3086655 [Pisolithus marmoratus]|nr:hypothetical protein EDC04DRAFT_3086655 [Pisolithus marmoratus]
MCNIPKLHYIYKEQLMVDSNKKATQACYKISLLHSKVIGVYSMEPELAEDGCNWHTYGSWVLKVISEDGLMSYLDGLKNDLQLQKTPHKTFAYLKNCYGSIPRPESLKVVDETVQQHDLPSEHVEENPPDIPSDSAETAEGCAKPKAEVIDAQQVEDDIEDRAADLEWPAECTSTLKTPDKDVGNAVGQAGVQLQMPIEDNQFLLIDDKTIVNTPDPPDVLIECLMPWNNSVVMGNTLEDPSGESERSLQLQETERPQPDRDHAPEGCHSQPTCKNPPVRIQEMGVHGRAEASEGDSANLNSTTIKVEIRSSSMETAQAPPYSPHLERHTKEPDREQASSSHSDAGSREFIDSHGVRKAMLADRGCQHAACQTKRPNSLPAPPEPPLNSIHSISRTVRVTHHRGRLKPRAENISNMCMRQDGHCAKVVPMRPLCPLTTPSGIPYWKAWPPNHDTKQSMPLLADSKGQHTEREAKCPRPYRVPHQLGRVKTNTESISGTHTRQDAYRAHAAPKWSLPPLLVLLKRSLDPAGGSWMINVCCNKQAAHALGLCHRRTVTAAPLDPAKQSGNIAGGPPIPSVRYNEVSDAGNVQTRGYLHPGEHTHDCATNSPSRKPKKRRKLPWDIAGTYQRQGVPHPSTCGDNGLLYGQHGGLTTSVQGQRMSPNGFPKWQLPQRGMANTAKQCSHTTWT